jgi:hypothetical protein
LSASDCTGVYHLSELGCDAITAFAVCLASVSANDPNLLSADKHLGEAQEKVRIQCLPPSSSARVAVRGGGSSFHFFHRTSYSNITAALASSCRAPASAPETCPVPSFRPPAATSPWHQAFGSSIGR